MGRFRFCPIIFAFQKQKPRLGNAGASIGALRSACLLLARGRNWPTYPAGGADSPCLLRYRFTGRFQSKSIFRPVSMPSA